MKKTTGLIGLLALACATVVAAAASASAAPSGRGAVALRNVQTGLCLDGDFGGKVYTKGCGSDNPYQHWYLHEGPMGVMLQSSKTGLCITGKGWATTALPPSPATRGTSSSGGSSGT